ncbi:MAG: hypothetical protein AAGF90_21020 [Pseudomonadota bacterium]
MNPVVTGVLAFAALALAFVAGSFIEFDGDSVEIEITEDGPLEQIGEELDEATGESG